VKGLNKRERQTVLKEKKEERGQGSEKETSNSPANFLGKDKSRKGTQDKGKKQETKVREVAQTNERGGGIDKLTSC